MKLLTINETTERLGLKRWTITEMLESGQLPGVVIKSGKRKKIWRIREDALREWVTKKEAETKKLIHGSAMLKAAV